MFWRFSKDIGFEFLYEKMALVSEFHNLMMKKDGQKYMKILVCMYDLFSEWNMDMPDEKERLKVLCGKEGISENDKMLYSSEYVQAKAKFMEMNYDVEAEQIKNVEFCVSKLIKERDTIMKNEILSLEDLEKVETITKSLKDMFNERETLMEHFTQRCRGGSVGKGKLIGNKKLSHLSQRNNARRLETEN